MAAGCQNQNQGLGLDFTTEKIISMWRATAVEFPEGKNAVVWSGGFGVYITTKIEWEFI